MRVVDGMAKRGRPPLEDPTKVRTRTLGVKVNTAEEAELKWAAEQQKERSVGSWLRSLGLAAAKRLRRRLDSDD